MAHNISSPWGPYHSRVRLRLSPRFFVGAYEGEATRLHVATHPQSQMVSRLDACSMRFCCPLAVRYTCDEGFD